MSNTLKINEDSTFDKVQITLGEKNINLDTVESENSDSDESDSDDEEFQPSENQELYLKLMQRTRQCPQRSRHENFEKLNLDFFNNDFPLNSENAAVVINALDDFDSSILLETEIMTADIANPPVEEPVVDASVKATNTNCLEIVSPEPEQLSIDTLKNQLVAAIDASVLEANIAQTTTQATKLKGNIDRMIKSGELTADHLQSFLQLKEINKKYLVKNIINALKDIVKSAVTIIDVVDTEVSKKKVAKSQAVFTVVPITGKDLHGLIEEYGSHISEMCDINFAIETDNTIRLFKKYYSEICSNVKDGQVLANLEAYKRFLDCSDPEFNKHYSAERKMLAKTQKQNSKIAAKSTVEDIRQKELQKKVDEDRRLAWEKEMAEWLRAKENHRIAQIKKKFDSKLNECFDTLIITVLEIFLLQAEESELREESVKIRDLLSYYTKG